MAFCGVKNEHLDWVMGMTYALMREGKSVDNVIKEVAKELPLDKPSIAATLLSNIPGFSQILMAEDTDLGDEYGSKFMEIQQLKKRFEGNNGYSEVIDFINNLELSDKVDAVLDAIEEESLVEPTPNVETKSETIIKTINPKEDKQPVKTDPIEDTTTVDIGDGITLENKIENEEPSQNKKAKVTEKGAGNKNGQRVIQDFGKSIRPKFRNAVPDRLKEKLTEHQKVGVNAIVQAVETGNRFLLADGAGAGKTRVLLTSEQALKNSGKKEIIVTENKEIISGSFKADSKELGMPFSQDRSQNGVSDGISIVTVSNFRDKINSSEYDVVFIDESQNASGLTSQIAEKVKNFEGQIVFASATPFDTEEKTVYILPRLFGISESDYLKMIGGQLYTRPRRGTELVFPSGKAKFVKVLNATHERLISEGKMLHRRYEFFGDDNLNVDTIGAADEFGGGYSIDQLEEGVNNFYKEKAKRVQLTESDIRAGETEESKRRAINELKSNALKRIPETFKANNQFLNQIEEDLKAGKQIIIYGVNVKEDGLAFDILTDEGEAKKVVRPAFLKQMEKRLKDRGLDFGVVTGQTKNRSKTVDSFQKGELKILLINESGTTGINLNDTVGDAPRRLYISGALPNAIQLEQIKGRVSRLNNASAAEVVYVSVNSEVESRNRGKLLGKMAILNRILKGDQLDSNTETEENKKEIAKEISNNPKAPYIEDDTDGRTFTVKNSFPIKQLLSNLKGTYRRGFEGWKFPMERKEEIMRELNIISAPAIKTEVQINKVQNEITQEESLDKSVTIPSPLSYGLPRTFYKVGNQWKELLGGSFLEVDEATQTLADNAFNNKPTPKLSAQEEQFRIDPKVQERLRNLMKPSDENIDKANDEENTPCK
jgi:hypothetical protein